MRVLIVLSIITVTQGNRRRLGDLQKEFKASNGQDTRSNPVTYLEHVDFRHYSVDGYGDPTLDLKRPIDLLEGDMVHPKTLEEAKELLSKVPLRNIQLVKTGKKKEEPKYAVSSEESASKEHLHKTNTTKTLFNFAKILEQNVQRMIPPPAALGSPPARSSHIGSYSVDLNNEVPKTEYFAKNSFELRAGSNGDKENWTSCKEFGKGAYFHPKDIVNFNWVPFYIWSNRPMVMSIVHRFSVPTKKLVAKYVTNFSPYLNKSLIDWEQPKLVLHEVGEMLLVAKDRKGLFVAIPYQELPDSVRDTNFQLPLHHIKIKIDDPYLAITYCDEEHALIMAVEGNVPESVEDKIAEAQTLGFQGRGFPVMRDIEKEILREKVQRELTQDEASRKIIHVPTEKGLDVPKYYNKALIGPKGMEKNNSTTCEEFSRLARFNPYSVLDEPWMVFYYWAPHMPPTIYSFTVPNATQDAYLHRLLDPFVKEPVDWTATRFLMMDQDLQTSLMVERTDRGHYWLYRLYRDLSQTDVVEPEDVRFRQTGDNKYIGFMICKTKAAYVMSRLTKVPRKKNLLEAASRIGFRGRGGKSYLYQGTEWVPMPDATEWDFWAHPKYKMRFMHE